MTAAEVRGLGGKAAGAARAAEVRAGRARAKTEMCHFASHTSLASASGATIAVNDTLALMIARRRARACRARSAGLAINASARIASFGIQTAPGLISIGVSIAVARVGAVVRLVVVDEC